MASTDDTDGGGGDAASVAAALRSASFVRIVAHADATGAATAGVLANAAAATGVPFRVSLARTAEAATGRVAAGEATAVTVGVGGPATATIQGPRAPATAAEAARAVGHAPDPTPVLAGLVGAGLDPEGTAAFEAADVERHPGLGIPTENRADGLAHTTLVHGPFSGDPAAAEELLPDGDDPDSRRHGGSVVALEASTAATGQRGVAALGRALNPLAPGTPFATVAGYADVLGATAREAPGTAVALAVGADVRESALGTWRDHALRVHRAVEEADLEARGDVAVARVESGVWTVARLLRDFRSPAPAALAIGDGEAALAGRSGTGALKALSAAAEECAGSAAGGDTRAYAAFDGPAEDVVAAVRGMV